MGRVFITEGVRTGPDGSGYSCEDDDERVDSWDVVDSDSGAKYFGSEDYSTATRVSGVLNAICREHAAEVARLNEQMRALAAEGKTYQGVVFRLIGMLSMSGYTAVKDSLNPAEALFFDAQKALDDSVTDTILREVRADELDVIAAELVALDTVGSTGAIAYVIRQKAASIRAGEVQQ
ncbi:hypothetical protein OMR58_24575 [Erwinia sp. INIA-01]|uniref:hypothetical protein n=1 Tax=Erwinia sp. INIA01 TaxID=2991500 RepID=UPI0022259FAE|nr:hypothetical protein [Erwinia sp. INIA01]MCW1877618.1 hypothetical protein [Erwinia sp. INIA01]